jgi:two-component system cell cycle sensor histidine kinase/response regulator CckA
VLVVTLPVTALLVAMIMFYAFEQQSRSAELAVEQTFEMRGGIRRILTQMVSAETGIRGYLLTNRKSFLAPYETALRELPEVRRNLRPLVQDDPSQAERMRNVESLIMRILGDMEDSRQEIARGNNQRALAALEADKAVMDDLRDELALMNGEAERLLAARTLQARKVERRTSVVIFVGGAFGLLGGIFAALFFTNRIARRVLHLQEQARDVAAGRPLQPVVRGDDEIARLERTLVETSELLTARAEELHRVHEELEARVAQRTAELTAANEELRASKQFREAVVQSSPLAIWALDIQGKVTFWNPAAERIFGWTEAEVIGHPLPVVMEKDAQEHREWLQRFAAGESFSGIERRRQRKDGSPIDVMIWTAPLRDGEGRIRGVIAIDSDISQQKLLEEQFRQSQKLEAVGRLAGGVAHDFNNLLTVIQGYNEMVANEAGQMPNVVDYTREVAYAAGRATALTAQLLAFSRRQISQPKIVDLNEVVTHSMKLLRRVIGEDIEIVAQLDPQLGRVKVDPIHIDQVIMNLVVNARDAMTHGGRITIETRNQQLDAEYAGRHIGVSPGAYCMLAITDTGTGMTPELRSRIFEPFFTTKEAGRGTGLGLSIVYGIVKQNQGEIIVYSEPGRGTTFKVYLPAVEAGAGSAELDVRTAEAPGSESILLCEDDPKIRVLVEKMLARQGYRVITAESPEDALRIAAERTEPIDLLLTDVVMPRMNGFDLAKGITSKRPEMKVLYMSGYTDNHLAGGLELPPDLPFLQKPFTAAGLSEMVRQVLAGSGGTTFHADPP